GGHRGAPVPLPARAARQLEPAPGPAHHPVRHRRAPSAPDRPSGDRRAVPQGHGPARPPDRTDGAARMIEVNDLRVRFGGVTPIDGMTVAFPEGTCGLIGPNGAGKTTFFNVLSGLVKPVGGTVSAFGENLLGMPDFRRARWGLRRTFQTEQAIEKLSLFDNVALV